MGDIFDKCGQFLADPKIVGSGVRDLAADLFSTVWPPNNAGPWIETGDTRLLQFSSNDYLGLATHEDVMARVSETVNKYGIYAPMGSRLLTGTTEYHLELERNLAEFKRCEAAIIFPSGAMAMIGTMACLGGPNDVLILDEQAHATLVCGAKASGAKLSFFRHNDLEHLESILSRTDDDAGKAIVVDGVYSMYGDTAPLDKIVAIKKKYNARLIVDDAHGTGVFGPGGRGTAAQFGVEDDVDLHAGTFSKALGTIGGFIAGSAETIAYLRFHAPTYVFSKSVPLAVVVATLTSLELLKKADDRRERVWKNRDRLQGALKENRANIGVTQSPITPIHAKGNDSLYIAEKLRKTYGIWAAPVIFPAVQLGTSILRVIPTAMHTDSDIDSLVDAFVTIRGSMVLGSMSLG